jgi:autotransporter translocation and assembly factor TamB
MDQADILSVLVLGHRANEMGSGDSAQYSAAAGAVTLYGSSPLVESAKEALGLDSVVVGVGANSQLGFSKYLGDKTVLEYQQTFGALPEWWVNLRYRLDKSWSVQTSSNSKGTTGMDLFWERRY